MNASEGIPPVEPPASPPAPTECAACKEWRWPTKLPGTHSGQYIDQWGQEGSGNVCILHLRDANKNIGEMNFAIARKKAAKDWDFSGAFFAGDIGFSGELNDANFSGATFSAAAYFNSATFKDTAKFIGLAKSRDTEWKPSERQVSLDFSHVTLEKPELIRFADMEMTAVSLVETDVRKVDFMDDLDWPVQLRDETTEEGIRSPAQVERLYRQLRHNLEENKNFPDAGQFYYGEMQMRRKQMRWPQWPLLWPEKSHWLRRNVFSMPAIYYWSSGYGQRPVWALGWILLLLMGLSGANMVAGLHLDGDYPKELFSGPPLIDWMWGGAAWPSRVELQMAAHDFGFALLHTIQVATFSRIRWYLPINAGWGETINLLTVLLLPLLAALFVLAVRRRFKR